MNGRAASILLLALSLTACSGKRTPGDAVGGRRPKWQFLFRFVHALKGPNDIKLSGERSESAAARC